MAAQRTPLKDRLLAHEEVALIASEIELAYPAFPADEFVSTVATRLPELELKARIDWIAECWSGTCRATFAGR